MLPEAKANEFVKNKTFTFPPIEIDKVEGKKRKTVDPQGGTPVIPEATRKANNVFELAYHLEEVLIKYKASRREIQGCLKLLAANHELRLVSEFSAPVAAMQRVTVKDNEKSSKKGKKVVKQPSNPAKKKIRDEIDTINGQIKKESAVTGAPLKSDHPLLARRASLFAQVKALSAGSNPTPQGSSMQE